jgi:hypothetical protein
MKVKKLIEELSKLNPNTTVFIASDAEGNSFSAITSIYDENGNLAFNGKTDSSGVEFGVLVGDELIDNVFKRQAVILFPV